MLRLFIVLIFLLAVGCTSAQPTEAPPDPLKLITDAANKIRSADTFRISVNESGPDYMIYTVYTTVYFRRAVAQYVAPSMMQASIRVLAAGLPIEVDVFSRGIDQWYRAIWTGNQWINEPFAPDFNPEMLIAEDTGFQAALGALIDLTYVGRVQLENGMDVHHLKATADGPNVAALLGNLIYPTGNVDVDVYIDHATGFPARFGITEYDSQFVATPEPGQEAEPVQWTIDVYDINAAPEISTPPSLGAVDATPEASAEASVTAEATQADS